MLLNHPIMDQDDMPEKVECFFFSFILSNSNLRIIIIDCRDQEIIVDKQVINEREYLQ
jgi:hypothetical protein